MSKEIKFQYKSLQDRNSIQEYFRALLGCFENKQIVLSSGDKELITSIGELITLSIKAKKKGDKFKMTIKLEWKEEGVSPIKENVEALVIDSKKTN